MLIVNNKNINIMEDLLEQILEEMRSSNDKLDDILRSIDDMKSNIDDRNL